MNSHRSRLQRGIHVIILGKDVHYGFWGHRHRPSTKRMKSLEMQVRHGNDGLVRTSICSYKNHVPPLVALGELALEWLSLLSRTLRFE